MNRLNKRTLKCKSLAEDRSFKLNMREINSRELEAILNGTSELNEMDLLVFYYTNWCGMCKTLNFKLTQLMLKYFRYSTSFRLLK